MKTLIMSDLHGFGELPEIQPELVILLGDIEYYEIRKIDKKYNCVKMGVLGNHDAPDYFDNTSIINLHGQITHFNGYKIAGFQGCPKYNKRNFCQYMDEQVEEVLKDMERVDIFVAHSNPMLEANFDLQDAHRGFNSFTKYIEKNQPRYFFHGHIHDDKKIKIGETELISVFPYLILDL